MPKSESFLGVLTNAFISLTASVRPTTSALEIIVWPIFNSSMPSSNPGSLQVIKTCEALLKLNNQVELITPNTGLNVSVKKFYNLKKVPIINKIKFFKKFPIGINYYLFSIFAVIYSIKYNFDFVITRNPFTLFILTLFKKKVIIEFHHDLSIESRIVRFIFYNFNILNNNLITV